MKSASYFVYAHTHTHTHTTEKFFVYALVRPPSERPPRKPSRADCGENWKKLCNNIRAARARRRTCRRAVSRRVDDYWPPRRWTCSRVAVVVLGCFSPRRTPPHINLQARWWNTDGPLLITSSYPVIILLRYNNNDFL